MAITNSAADQAYGGFMAHILRQANFLNTINITNTFGYYNDKKFKDNDKNPQVSILNDGFVDPKTLSFHKRIRWTIKEFCYSTSCHGVPWIVEARNPVWRTMWTSLWLSCVTMFLYQGYKQIIRYNNYEKIVDIELKFDTIQFPAVTFCNLNPYKTSESKQDETFMKALNAFSEALKNVENNRKAAKIKAEEAAENQVQADRKKRLCDGLNRTSDDSLIRNKRARATDHTEMSKAVCVCGGDESGFGLCGAEPHSVPDESSTMCYCAFARKPDDSVGDVYPCAAMGVWTELECGNCDEHFMCSPDGTGSRCLCFMDNKFCNRIPEKGVEFVLNLWEYYNKKVVEKMDPEFAKALGFSTMTDELAITTRAQENTIFIAAHIEHAILLSMVHPKHEFIKKCSFNGAQCNIETDFMEVLDPSFGACYIYNYNLKVNRTSARAGSMYGLRVLLNINSTEYLPTTEATGVRITVHSKDAYPFPDSFGYSAPTGTISSFGKTVSRLPPPYGNCVEDARDEHFIYQGYAYSIEACYRSCFQRFLTKKCNCGDPRIPAAPGKEHCSVGNSEQRRCLERESSFLGGLHGDFDCSCPQSCLQSVFAFSYSAAQWPAGPSDMLGAVECKEENNGPEGAKKCKEFNQENGVMVEVFYEQLNFESLEESRAYMFVNLLADFGGQLGLWMGISVISVFEFIMLLYDLLWLTARHHYKKYMKQKEEECLAADRI